MRAAAFRLSHFAETARLWTEACAHPLASRSPSRLAGLCRVRPWCGDLLRRADLHASRATVRSVLSNPSFAHAVTACAQPDAETAKIVIEINGFAVRQIEFGDRGTVEFHHAPFGKHPGSNGLLPP